jgi:hypothetical protein
MAEIFGNTTATPINPELFGGGGNISKEELNEKLGDIETALDTLIADQEAIIAIQNALIGGGGE